MPALSNITTLVTNTCTTALQYSIATVPAITAFYISGAITKLGARIGNAHLAQLGLLLNDQASYLGMSSILEPEPYFEIAQLATTSNNPEVLQLLLEHCPKTILAIRVGLQIQLRKVTAPQFGSSATQINEFSDVASQSDISDLDIDGSSSDGDESIFSEHSDETINSLPQDNAAQGASDRAVVLHTPMDIVGCFSAILKGIAETRGEIGFVLGTDILEGNVWQWLGASSLGFALLMKASNENISPIVCLSGAAIGAGTYYLKAQLYSTIFSAHLSNSSHINEKSANDFLYHYGPRIVFDITLQLVEALPNALLKAATYQGMWALGIPILIAGTRSVVQNGKEYWDIRNEEIQTNCTSIAANLLVAGSMTYYIFSSASPSQHKIINSAQIIGAAFASFAMMVNIYQISDWTLPSAYRFIKACVQSEVENALGIEDIKPESDEQIADNSWGEFSFIYTY